MKFFKKTALAAAAVMITAALPPTAAVSLKNMNIDTFGRKIERITQSTPIKQQGYEGLGGIFESVYYFERNSSWLSGGDFVEIVPVSGDNRLHLHSDIYAPETNKNIELYKSIEMTLDNGYNFIYEMDVMLKDGISGLSIDLKFDGVWKNVAFEIPAGTFSIKANEKQQSLNQNEWHHIAVELHKESNTFSIYVDGNILLEKQSFSVLQSKPLKFNAITIKMNRNSAASDIYMDNIRWYEQYESYNPNQVKAEINSSIYQIGNTDIYGVPSISAESFLSNLNVSSGAEAAVMKNGGEGNAASGKNVSDGMLLRVQAADGLTCKYYKIHSSAQIAFYNETGEEISCIVEPGSITARVQQSGKNTALCMALYQNGALRQFGLFKNGEMTVTGIENQEEYSVKVFNWESLENIRPEEDAVSLKNKAHPFMIVRREDYQMLQKKSETSPWKEMKDDALEKFPKISVNKTAAYTTRCDNVRDGADIASLVYILESSKREEAIAKILEMISYWNEGVGGNLYDELYKTTGDHWNTAIPPAAAFVHCLLALDIIHDDLTSEQLKSAESSLKKIADIYIATNENHMVGIWGVRGLWAMYTGDEKLLETSWENWLGYYNGYISESGAGAMSAGYSLGRFVSSSRTSKIILPLVMEYTGRVNNFYDTDKYIGFAEWALGYTYTPSKQVWLIGDTSASSGINTNDYLMAYNAAKYSDEAAKSASWLLKNKQHKASLLNYLMTQETFDNGEAPKSRIFTDGGAWFYEDLNNINSLGGYLWNITTDDGHAHKETNSVNIAAYGEMLTVNSGYIGWNQGAAGYTWNYINQRAMSANTVLVDYNYGNLYDPSTVNDHKTKTGAGITEGFTSEKFCYALGNSGKALPNAVHERGFIMVGGESSAPGYFVLLDTVDKGNKMTVVHRPFSANYKKVTDNAEYTWTVNRISGHDVGLSVFLATKPDNTEIIDGITAQWDSAVHIKPMLAEYPAGETAMTVLYPFDVYNPKAQMSRISGGAQGAVISNGAVSDYILQYGNVDNISYSGKTAIVRKISGAPAWYFAREANSFSCEDIGFESKEKISIYMNDSNGAAYSPCDTQVKLYTKNVSEIRINGRKCSVWDNNGESVSFLLPAGESSIEIIR